MLTIDLKAGETVVIGKDKAIKVRMEEKKGQVARLSFEADRSIPITRVPKNKPRAARAAAALGIGKKPTGK